MTYNILCVVGLKDGISTRTVIEFRTVHERSIVVLTDVLTNVTSVVIMIIYTSGFVHRFVVR